MQIKHDKVQQVGVKKFTRELVPSASFINDRQLERQPCFSALTAPVNALSEINHSFRERTINLGVPETAPPHLTLFFNHPCQR
jgi:hypothetical protein